MYWLPIYLRGIRSILSILFAIDIFFFLIMLWYIGLFSSLRLATPTSPLGKRVLSIYIYTLFIFIWNCWFKIGPNKNKKKKKKKKKKNSQKEKTTKQQNLHLTDL